jgi:hypothetical protein
MQRGIQAAAREQLAMISHFDDSSLVEHDDPVSA